MTAIAIVVNAGCEQQLPQAGAQLESIEANGETLPLPRTTVVTCHHISNGRLEFWWEGTDVLTPRRPLDENHSSSFELRFTANPLAPVALTLHMRMPDHDLNVEWPNAAESSTLTLDSDQNERHYILRGSVTQPDRSPRRIDVRAAFRC